jgi:DNA-binding MarR family transcriptional regulator
MSREISEETETPEKAALILEVINEVRRQQGVSDVLEQVACDRMGINRTDARCVDIIDRAGRITAGQLAEESGLTTGSVTALLDRMERDGYVRRVADDHDRRRVLFELTERVHELTAELYDPVKKEGHALLERYTGGELVLLRDFLAAGTAFLTEHTAKLSALGPAAGVVPRGLAQASRASRLEERLEKTRDKVDQKMSKLERKVGQSREKLDRNMEKLERKVGRGSSRGRIE